jgi:pimeloyl-ACP methyl ester carboxylesterase
MPKTNAGPEMYYEIEGDGPPVVLIGGLSQDHFGWMMQVPAVAAAGYRCITFDNRDAGQTALSTKSYDIRQMADDTMRLMDAIGLPSAHIVGLSMGGMIGQEMAISSPERVSSLTLVCTSAATAPETAGVLRAWRDARPHCDDVDFVLMVSAWLFTHRFYQDAASVEGFLGIVRSNPFPQSAAGFVRQCDAVLSHDTRDRISQIRAPTRIIVGAEDTLTPPRQSRWLAERIPGAELVEIPNAAHLLSLETADEFNRALIEFLQAQPKTAAV